MTTDTARYDLRKKENLERIALDRKEKERIAALPPIERNLCTNKAKPVDTYTFDGIRMYERKSGHTESVALVYDGRLDEETASQLAAASRVHPAMITVFYTPTKNPNSTDVRGFNPVDMDYFKTFYHENTNTGNQFSVEIEGFGTLEKTVVDQARTILENARKRTSPKV